MKKADASGARYAALIGDDEVQAGNLTMKPLRAPRDVSNSGAPQPTAQARVDLAQAVALAAAR
jgi:histidyl-tRNA synthetase